MSIERILAERPELKELIRETAAQMRKAFPRGSRVVLAQVGDDLCLTIHTNLPFQKGSACLAEFDRWWTDRLTHCESLITTIKYL